MADSIDYHKAIMDALDRIEYNNTLRVISPRKPTLTAIAIESALEEDFITKKKLINRQVKKRIDQINLIRLKRDKIDQLNESIANVQTTPQSVTDLSRNVQRLKVAEQLLTKLLKVNVPVDDLRSCINQLKSALGLSGKEKQKKNKYEITHVSPKLSSSLQLKVDALQKQIDSFMERSLSGEVFEIPTIRELLLDLELSSLSLKTANYYDKLHNQRLTLKLIQRRNKTCHDLKELVSGNKEEAVLSKSVEKQLIKARTLFNSLKETDVPYGDLEQALHKAFDFYNIRHNQLRTSITENERLELKERIVAALTEYLEIDLDYTASQPKGYFAKLQDAGISRAQYMSVIRKHPTEINALLDAINLREEMLKQIDKTKKFFSSHHCVHMYHSALGKAIEHRSRIQGLLAKGRSLHVFRSDLDAVLSELKSTIKDLTAANIKRDANKLKKKTKAAAK